MENETYSVYTTQNLLDPAKAYVGMSKRNDPKYWGSDVALKADIKRLGVENFTKTILGTFTDHMECHYWEGFYVKTLKTHISFGGYNKSWTGGIYIIMSDETKEKLSIAMKGKKQSEEHLRNNGLAHKGLKRSDETKVQMSCRKHSDEAKTKMSLARKGLKRSDEAKAKMSLSLKGRKRYIDENGKTRYRKP